MTESGFGADMGMEKFFNIKCRYSGLVPNCVVMVATIRALKMHGGGPKVVAGQPLNRAYTEENLELVEKGCSNLIKMIENARRYGIPVVAGVNRFQYDTTAEIDLVRRLAIKAGAVDAVMTNHWAEGGAGAVTLGKAVIAACDQPSEFRFLYPLEMSIKDKIETIVREMYGGAGVEYSPEAERKIAAYIRLGFSDLPICMAKTHLSLSHDPNLKGAPTGFIVPVRRDLRCQRCCAGGFSFQVVEGTAMSHRCRVDVTAPCFYDIGIWIWKNDRGHPDFPEKVSGRTLLAWVRNPYLTLAGAKRVAGRQNRKNGEVLIRQAAIESASVSRSRRQIARDFAGQRIHLIGVLKGACIFLSDLVREINLETSIDFIAVSSYGRGRESSGQVRLVKDLDTSIAGLKRRISILVEDILDTGLTLTYLLRILRQRKPKTLCVAALLDKPSRRVKPVKGDYIGFTIPDVFVVGYGLDYAERYRNLKDVCVLKLPPA